MLAQTIAAFAAVIDGIAARRMSGVSIPYLGDDFIRHCRILFR